MLPVRALEYDLPEELIAVRPAEPRDASRLMVVSRTDSSRLEHRRFADLPGLLNPGDLLVFNTSAVVPARLSGRRADTGGKVNGLYLSAALDGRWRAMLQAGGRLREGAVVMLEGERSALRIVGREGEQFILEPIRWPTGQPGGDADPRPAMEILAEAGATPLPPYILGARRDAGVEIPDEQDRRWYQTVLADPLRPGSVAAPTAGLHFTDGLMRALSSRGVGRADVVLHVGPGTFKPVQTEFIEQHAMHAEWWCASAKVRQSIDAARSRSGRIIPVGTTSTRVLESMPREAPAGGGDESGETRLLISPGFRFNHTDGLITNFHLPRSTLMALVAALLPGGAARLVDLYRLAVRERYRFYSYGDAMLILP